MAAHHCSDRSRVGRAAGGGIEDRGDLAEVVGAEDAGGDDRQRLRAELADVGELVDCPAGDAEHLAGADLVRVALDRPDERALEAVDRLLVAVVAVRRRDFGAGRDVELEHRHRAVRLLALEQETDGHLPDSDLFACACR